MLWVLVSTDPVFFASRCGGGPTTPDTTSKTALGSAGGDQRAHSIGAAVEFAKSNNLLGIFIDAELLVSLPSSLALLLSLVSFSLPTSLKGVGSDDYCFPLAFFLSLRSYTGLFLQFLLPSPSSPINIPSCPQQPLSFLTKLEPTIISHSLFHLRLWSMTDRFVFVSLLTRYLGVDPSAFCCRRD